MKRAACNQRSAAELYPFRAGPKPDFHDGQPIFADGYTVAPDLPQFFKSKCANPTPYLAGAAGDQIKQESLQAMR